MKRKPDLLRFLHRMRWISDERKIALYPPFLFMGVKVLEISKDRRRLVVRLPLRWYGKNHNGTMFGGHMASLADPLPAVLCGYHFPKSEVWTKKMSIQFLRPGKSDLTLVIELTDQHLDEIRRDLSLEGRSRPHFRLTYTDDEGHQVAIVDNVVAIQRPGSGLLRRRLKALFETLGTEKVGALLEDFYLHMSQDILLAHFFIHKDPRQVAHRQLAFMLKAAGLGSEPKDDPLKAPGQAHDDIPPIWEAHFDRRMKLLAQLLHQNQLQADHQKTWIDFENSFRHVVVKPQ